MSKTTGTVFENNRTQSVRLPVETRFPKSVKRVNVRVRGNERILTPADQTWDSFFLGEACVSDDFMQGRADQFQPEREPL
jgi:antitoxin VapB